MVWNGRNESLGLGLKAAAATAATTAVDAEVSKSNDTASPSPATTATIKSSSPADTKTSTTTAASNAQPSKAASSGKSVWNGTHHKIMEISEKSSSNKNANINDSISKVVEIVEKSTISPPDNNAKEQSIVVSPTTTVDTTPVVTKDQGKEDDVTTNSTAGSSTTNTLDEDPNMLDTVTMASSESEEKKSEDQPSTPSATEEANDTGTATSASAARNATANATNTTTNNKQKNSNKNKKAQGNTQQQQARRTGSNKNRSNSVGNNKQNNKGNNGAAGRRKANKEKEVVCAFFLKNMCNRGAACTFRHDNAAVGGTVKTTKQHHSKKFHKQPNAAIAAPQSKPPTTTAAYPFASKRVFDPYKAKAITLAKGAQDQEDRSAVCTAFRISDDGLVKEEIADPPFFSIDVECIATGYGSCARGINDGCGNEGKNGADVPAGMYNDRSHRYPGRVAMVNTDGNVLADIIIRPPQDGKGIVSYLTPLTGLTEEVCLGADAKTLEEAVQTIKGLLPKDGVLVGQAIDHDVEWLGLTPGKDFARMIDISEIFRQRMPSNLNDAAEVMKKIESGEISAPSAGDVASDEYLGFATRYRHFSLRHVCLNLLSEDIQSGVHNPVSDASYSLKLFHKYRNAGVTQLRIVRDGLHRAPPTPSFSQECTPVIDGVCVSAVGYKYKRAARKIWRWYAGKKTSQC